MMSADVSTATIKLAVCEDDRSYRKLLVKHFEESGGYSVRSAADLEELLELLKSWPADVVLFDLYYKGVPHLEGAREIRKASPNTKVLTLTYSAYDGDVRQALETSSSASFDGYLTKDIDPDDMDVAIKETLRGRRYIDPIVGEFLLTNEQRDLTASEKIVLQGLADGKSHDEIAAELPPSGKTGKPVGTRQVNRLEKMAQVKLGAKTTHEAISIAHRRRLIR